MTWQNIADAQVSWEQAKNDAQQAANKGSLFSSLFGSKSNTTNNDDENIAPVQLSTEELKELEALTLEQFAEAESSKDSRLCDRIYRTKWPT